MSDDAPDFFRGKRLVVFGAGYVGQALARQASQAGARVIALTRNPEKVQALRAQGIEAVEADLATASWHPQIEGAADFGVNCVSSGGGGTAAYRRSYYDGMRSIAEWAAARGGFGTFVYTSSTSVYPQDDGALVTEDDAAEPTGEGPQILRETEQLLAQSPAIAKRWFIFRLAGIYGPGRHQLLDQLRSGATELPGRADHRLNLIHRDDVCAAILAALSAPFSLGNEVFNLADNAPTPKGEVISWLAQRLGIATPIFTGTATPGRRAVVPDRLVANAKVQALLGWRPRFASFRDGYETLLGA
jgi:nucleoside-diphosphate-sugar epimerase